MITYVNSGNDAKSFNTFALAAKHSLIKKQQAINTQIDYLKSVYNRYVSHYNQLQKLIKEVNDLTGESRYTKVDYSDFPAVDISASFSMKLSNIRLVPEGTSSLRFKNTIEDLRSNFSDLSLSIKSFYNRTMTELSPYGSMRQKTNNIREGSSKASTVVGTNINTALTEGDLSTKDWSNIKEHAEREKNKKEKTLEESDPTNPTNPTAPSTEDLEREAREEAEKAAKEAFNEEQSKLDENAKKAREKLNKADLEVQKFGSGFDSCIFVTKSNDGTGEKTSYYDISTGEGFASVPDVYETYFDSNGLTTAIIKDPDTGQWAVIKGNSVTEEYDTKADAITAANELAGKDVFSNGIINTAKETYEKSKQKAIEVRDKAQKESDKAAEAAEAHRNSAPSSDSNGGT